MACRDTASCAGLFCTKCRSCGTSPTVDTVTCNHSHNFFSGFCLSFPFCPFCCLLEHSRKHGLLVDFLLTTLFQRFEAANAAYVSYESVMIMLDQVWLSVVCGQISYQSVVVMLDQVLLSAVCGQISHSLLFEQLVFGLLIGWRPNAAAGLVSACYYLTSKTRSQGPSTPSRPECTIAAMGSPQCSRQNQQCALTTQTAALHALVAAILLSYRSVNLLQTCTM